MDDIKQVQVEILGKPFNIGTPSSEYATLMQAVEMLNDKITAIQSTGRVIETDKIVIMAALNLTHDLLKMTLTDGLAIGDFERKIESMLKVCNDALAS